MTFKQQYNSLCSPAKLYLVISGVSILLLFIQNLHQPNHYQVGSYKIPLSHHNIFYFLIKVVIVGLWTWALNKFCSKGYKGVAWFLVIVPYILFFVGIGLVVVSGMKQKPTQARIVQPVYMQAPVYAQQPVYQQAAPAGPQRSLYGREGPIYATQAAPALAPPPPSPPAIQ